MTEPTWQRVCLLCIQRDRTTRLESGHCCAACAGWLATQIADIARLAADAAAWVAPGSSTGGSGRPVPGSRPPLRVDALDPELTPVPQFDGQVDPPTLLQLLEIAEREIREARGMAPYGPASAARSSGLFSGTSVTLIGCVDFLGRQVPWMTTTTDFGLEDFADMIRSCVRALRRWDPALEDMGYPLPCPTLLTDGGECGQRLHVHSLMEIDGRNDHVVPVTCPACGVQREAAQLIAATIDTAHLPASMIAERLGIPEGTIRRWADQGKVERDGRKFRFGDVRRLAIERRLRRGA